MPQTLFRNLNLLDPRWNEPRGGYEVLVEGDTIREVSAKPIKAANARVVDCGKDCPVATLVEAAAREKAAGVLVSGLISSIIPRVRQVRPALAAAGLGHLPILVGGAALKQCSVLDLDVDAVAETAFDGARIVDSWFGTPP